MALSPKTKDILETAGNFLTTFVTAVVAIVAIALVIVKLLGWNMFCVESGSMSPVYPINTLVIVKSVEPETIQVGDVVTYILNEDGVLVTHRVVSINTSDRTFTTKGDANNTEDAPVRWENVVGKVIMGIPKVGRPIRYLTDTTNRPKVIAVIAVLFIGSLAWDMAVRRKKKQAEKEPKKAEEGGKQEP